MNEEDRENMKWHHIFNKNKKGKECSRKFQELQAKLALSSILSQTLESKIDSEFVEVVAFRHAHEVVFEKSDLFFVCILKPVSSQIKVDDLEIQAVKWIPLMKFVET